MLSAAGFTGDIETTFRDRLRENLGRPIDQKLADLGRLLWFDNVHSLHKDNTCGGCHSPSNGFGDTQPMAIGVQSNLIVGPNRAGPRNQRRTPLVINTALVPALMWNGRFNRSLATRLIIRWGSSFLCRKMTTNSPTQRTCSIT